MFLFCIGQLGQTGWWRGGWKGIAESMTTLWWGCCWISTISFIKRMNQYGFKINVLIWNRISVSSLFYWCGFRWIRVAIRPVFPGHVPFLGLKILSGRIFLIWQKSGFFDKWSFVVIPYKFNAFVKFLMFRFFTCDNSESWSLSQRLLFKNLVKSR